MQPPAVAVKQKQNEIADEAASKFVEMTLTTVQKSKKKKKKVIKNANAVAEKMLLKKKRNEKKTFEWIGNKRFTYEIYKLQCK